MEPSISSRLRRARLDAGLSHDRLAEAVGTTRSHLIKLEKGVHAPRERMLLRISEATGKPVEYFRDPTPLVVDPADQLKAATQQMIDALNSAVQAAVALQEAKASA